MAAGAQAPVLVLYGPTGTGKTDWAVALAGELPVEIVSVDSALVYRGLDVGTAKPSAVLRGRIPHHLIDLCDPAESYSAGRFVRDALSAVAGIEGRGRIPLLVGGTMLYFKALFQGLAILPEANPALRAQLDQRAGALGWPALHGELAALDPEAARRIAPNDAQRIQRALEVCLSTGRRISELRRSTESPLAGRRVLRYGLLPGDRSTLHARLAQRFKAMMEAGFLEEVRALYSRGDLTATHPAIRSVGYRQLWAHLAGEGSLAEAVDRGIAATRQLAKRQLTWMRSDPSGIRLDPQRQEVLSWIRDIRAQLGDFGR